MTLPNRFANLASGIVGPARTIAVEMGKMATKLQDATPYCGDTWNAWALPIMRKFGTVTAKGAGWECTIFYPLRIHELWASGHSSHDVNKYFNDRQEALTKGELEQIEDLYYAYKMINHALARGWVPAKKLQELGLLV